MKCDAAERRRTCDVAYSMTFRIESATRGASTVFVLSGRIETQAMAELRRLFELHKDDRDIVLDLKDVGVVDREVMHFFASCEADGVKLENCTPYIREWMEREKD
jgi:anti-anti-sigma regulatory factor